MNFAEPRGPSRLLLNDGSLSFTEVLSPFPYVYGDEGSGDRQRPGDEKTIFLMVAADFDGDGGAHRMHANICDPTARGAYNVLATQMSM